MGGASCLVAAGDPDAMETSYSPAAAPGDPRNIRQRFLLRLPDRLIVFRTVRTPPGFPHAAEFQRVISVVELEPVGGGTRVRLSGTGYPAGRRAMRCWGFSGRGNRATWSSCAPASSAARWIGRRGGRRGSKALG
jgi:hypothetical protein